MRIGAKDAKGKGTISNFLWREAMKKSHRVVVGTVASLSLALAVAGAYAHPMGMGSGMGPGSHGAMGRGHQGGMGHGAMGGGFAGPMAGQQLMTPEERQALVEKMRSAKTPEERQKLAEATHAEMQKRAKDKGITLPEHRGPRFGTAPQAPATTEHTH